MKITKRQLRQVIRRAITESLDDQLKDMELAARPRSTHMNLPGPDPQDILRQVTELINVHYILDQGYDKQSIIYANDAEQSLKSQMSSEDFKKATKIAELCLYHNSYATQADVHQVVEEIEAACAELGLTAEDVI